MEELAIKLSAKSEKEPASSHEWRPVENICRRFGDLIGEFDRSFLRASFRGSRAGIEPLSRRDLRFVSAPHVRELNNGELHLMRGAPRNVLGVIDVEVADGVATLNGRVPGLTSKLLPASSRGGCRAVRDVFNGIEVEPPEDDCADVIVEAACAALERDPFVNASQINVDVHATSVRLYRHRV